MIYYVDSRYGSDSNDGLTRQTAFRSLEKINSMTLRSGDVVLLKCGEIYPGCLRPRRIRDGGLIRFDRYGVGDPPLIESEGSDAVELSDFDYVEICNLAITNPVGNRGIFIHNQAGGPLCHIYIRRCSIRCINEGRNAFNYESGGIICASFSDSPGWFEDLLIEDNDIQDVCRTGILITGFWANRPTKLWGKNEYVSDSENWWPSKGVVIRGNYIDRTGGDGIVVIGTESALIEWNTVYNVMTRPVTPCANAGIWPQSSNGCVVQFNEVGYTHKPDNCSDAQGFDVDLSCRNTLIQYNYSHDNEGGFLLLCELYETTEEDNFRGTVVRNNLSVNDGNVKGELIALVGPVRGVTIENNTLYATGNVDRIVEVFSPDGLNQARDVILQNNIFVANGKGNGFNLCNGENFVFNNNLYWGTYCEPPKTHENPIVEDPKFVLSGKCGKGRSEIAFYVPRNPRLADAGAEPLFPSEVDLLGRNAAEKTYIGALLPDLE